MPSTLLSGRSDFSKLIAFVNFLHRTLSCLKDRRRYPKPSMQNIVGPTSHKFNTLKLPSTAHFAKRGLDWPKLIVESDKMFYMRLQGGFT